MMSEYMSKLNFERPLFKFLRSKKIDENQNVTLNPSKPIGFVYECDGSFEDWKRLENLVPHVFPAAQHAVIYGDLNTFRNQAKLLPNYINPNAYLLLCNVLFENRRYVKEGTFLKISKLDGERMRWNLKALDGLLLAARDLAKTKFSTIRLDERFTSKLNELKENTTS